MSTRNKSTRSNPSQSTRQPAQQVAAVTQQTFHQGPIPDPSTLIKYNEAVPNAAERIIVMAEEQAKHRQSLEVETLDFNKKDRIDARAEIKLGQVFAFGLCLAVIASGTAIAFHGAEWPGVFLGSTGLSGIIIAYIKK